MKRSLQRELTLAFFLLTVGLLAAAFWFLVSHVRGSMFDQTAELVERQARLVERLSEEALQTGSFPKQADLLADRWGDALGIRVSLIRADGTVLGDSELDGEALAAVENHAARPEVRDAMARGIGRSVRDSATVHERLLYLALPVGGGKPWGVVRLAIPLARVEAAVGRVRKVFVGAFLVASLLALGIGVFVSRRVSRPIRGMVKLARDMASGNFSRRIARLAPDEMGDLAESVNLLAAQVQSRLDELAAAKGRLETIIESVGEGLLVTDAHQRVVLFNPAFTKLFALTESPLGRPVPEVLRHPKIGQVMSEAMKACGATIADELLVAGPEERWMRLHATALCREGRCQGVVCVIHDVTDLRRLERIRSDFVANVSHELRTPLTSIRGYAETLKEGALGEPARAREFVGVISKEADRLSKLIEDLLELSRLESGALPPDLRPLSLAPIVAQVLETLKPPLERKRLAVETDLPGDLPRVAADARAVHQILLNLLDNAVKYTPEGGRIRVAARPEGADLQILVADTGIGIPPEHLPRIFERFYRVDKSRSVELGGTGLGLSIVKHLVLAQKGRVWVESAPGKCSTFFFTLPLA